jgi:hypothetical protein
MNFLLCDITNKYNTTNPYKLYYIFENLFYKTNQIDEAAKVYIVSGMLGHSEIRETFWILTLNQTDFTFDNNYCQNILVPSVMEYLQLMLRK